MPILTLLISPPLLGEKTIWARSNLITPSRPGPTSRRVDSIWPRQEQGGRIMKRNGGAERDRCIIERLSRNRIITSPFKMCYRHRENSNIKQCDLKRIHLDVRNIEAGSGEVSMAPACNCWHSAVVYQQRVRPEEQKQDGRH